VKHKNSEIIFDNLFELLFPKVCLSCGKEGEYICSFCYAKIPVRNSFHCYVCNKRSPAGKICASCKQKTGSNLTGLLTTTEWNNLLIRKVIYEYKYRFIKDLSCLLAAIMIKFLNTNNLSKPLRLFPEESIFIPVPLHKKRLNWRGFNQAELLAEKIADYFQVPMFNNLLWRHHYVAPQMEIKNKDCRMKNVSRAFDLNPDLAADIRNNNRFKNKIFILVDDICTTGATLNDCARALAPLNPKQIWGLVVAKG
jgi:competence protein ComFC